jgi:RNA polymerase sigma-70 factor (ECF subfamily)
MKTKKQIEFMKLYEPIHNSFVRFCEAKSYGIIETEDLVNDTILNAFANFEKLKEKKAFLSYLFSIASNIINNNLRKKKIVNYTDNIDFQIEDKSQNSFETKSEIEQLYKALNKLQNDQKEAIILFELSGFSIIEISAIQNTSISSVKQRLKRGREKLSKILICPKLSSENVLLKSQILMNMFFL